MSGNTTHQAGILAEIFFKYKKRDLHRILIKLAQQAVSKYVDRSERKFGTGKNWEKNSLYDKKIERQEKNTQLLILNSPWLLSV